MQGRKPKPGALLTLEKGKLYSDQRDREKYEPKPVREIKPRCPARFSKGEKKAWRDIAAVLKNYNLFTVANSIQMELLASAWAQYIEVSHQLSLHPQIIMKNEKTSVPMYNPYFKAQHKLGLLVDKYSQNLGLSSIALAKIGSLTLSAKKKKSEMESLID